MLPTMLLSNIVQNWFLSSIFPLVLISLNWCVGVKSTVNFHNSTRPFYSFRLHLRQIEKSVTREIKMPPKRRASSAGSGANQNQHLAKVRKRIPTHSFVESRVFQKEQKFSIWPQAVTDILGSDKSRIELNQKSKDPTKTRGSSFEITFTSKTATTIITAKRWSTQDQNSTAGGGFGCAKLRVSTF